MKQSFWSAVLFIVAVHSNSAMSSSGELDEPAVVVKNTAELVVAYVKTNLGESREVLKAGVQEIVIPVVDFTYIASHLLGYERWQQLDVAHRDCFVFEIQRDMADVFMNAARDFWNASFEYHRVILRGDEATVRGRAVKDNGGIHSIPITFKFMLGKTTKGWKIRNLVVERLDVVHNYKTAQEDQINHYYAAVMAEECMASQ